MRAADLPGRLPQAPSGRRSAALQLLLADCNARSNSVPPKESALALKTRERMPPPKLPLTTVAEHDPIYPYQTLLVLRSLLAMTVPATLANFFRANAGKNSLGKSRLSQTLVKSCCLMMGPEGTTSRLNSRTCSIHRTSLIDR